MKRTRIVVLSALAVLVCTTAFAQSWHVAGMQGKVVRPPSDWWTEGISQPHSPAETNENAANDPDICCDDGMYGFPDSSCSPGGPYDADGVTTIEINSFWIDEVTADECAAWTPIFDAGIKPKPGPVIFLFVDEPVNFGDICEFVGKEAVFCISYDLTPPNLDFPNPRTVLYSFGVDTPNGSLPAPAVVDSFQVF